MPGPSSTLCAPLGDGEVLRLLDFYRCYYAYVRGKVISFRVDDPHIGRADGMPPSGRRHAILISPCPTRRGPQQDPHPRGRPDGNGQERAGPGPCSPDWRGDHPDGYRPKGNAPDSRLGTPLRGVRPGDLFGRRLPEDLRESAGNGSRETEDGRCRIIDASYKDREERSRAFEAGRRAGAEVVVLECICPEDIIEKRLQSRLSGGGDVSTGDGNFPAQKGSFERIEEIPEGSHLVVDTSLAPEKNALEVLRKMLGLE